MDSEELKSAKLPMILELIVRCVLRWGYICQHGLDWAATPRSVKHITNSVYIRRILKNGFLPEKTPARLTKEFIWPFKDLRIYDLSEHRTYKKIVGGRKIEVFKVHCHVCKGPLLLKYKTVYIEDFGLLICHNCHDMTKYFLVEIFNFIYSQFLTENKRRGLINFGGDSYIKFIQEQLLLSKLTERKAERAIAMRDKWLSQNRV